MSEAAMRRRATRALLGALIGLCLAVVLMRTPDAEAATLPPGFTEETVFSGLNLPTAVRFSQDGRVFVAEKSGLIKVYSSLTDTTADVYADLRPKVYNIWDRGLLGLALHPSFPTVSSVYALYSLDAPIGRTPPVYNDSCPDNGQFGCVGGGRLSRIAADGTETVLIEDWCQQWTSHSIGSIVFGPDGQLYVSGGEGASANFVDYGQSGNPVNPCGDPPGGVGGSMTPPTAEGGALRAQDLRTRTDPTNLSGSILRVDPTTGAASSTNPAIGDNAPNARRIVAYGLRNPFRMTFRPGTSELWIGDVGWGNWEEINRLTSATTFPIENFGWPCYEGANRQSGYDNANLNLCENLYSTSGAVTGPYHAYRHSDRVVPNESCPVGGSSMAGLAFQFYSGGPYPPEYDGALFFADYSRNCIWAMQRSGSELPSPSNIKTFVGGAATPVDLQLGPGGLLYYVDVATGSIRRIAYSGAANQAPRAVVSANPTTGDAPLTVTFSSAGSSDPEGSALGYAWDLDGDGAFDDSTAAAPVWTYTANGNVVAALRVTDAQGATGTASITIGVGRPKVTITAPTSTTTWGVGQSIGFSGSASDSQGNPIPASGLNWRLTLYHGACPDCHEHQLQSYAGVASGTFTAPDHEFPSELELSLTATDAAGLSNTARVRLKPRTVAYTFATSPTGLNLTLNGSTRKAPFTATLIAGSQNSVSAPSPQNLRGKYYWQSWSDGGAQSHNITASSTNTTLTATFRR